MVKWDIFREKREVVIKRYINIKQRVDIMIEVYKKMIAQKLLKQVIKTFGQFKKIKQLQYKKKCTVLRLIVILKIRLKKLYAKK